MIVQTITAESIKCFKNEVRLGDIKKLGGMSVYLDHFLSHMKKRFVESLALETFRINEDVPAELTALINEYEKAHENDVIKTDLTDDTELVVVYHAYSDIHQLYYLKSEDKVLQGLDCDTFTLPVNEDYKSFLPFVSDGSFNTPTMEFTFVNSEDCDVVYKYPGMSVFDKATGQLVVDVEWWNDGDFDIVEPEEKLFFEDTKELYSQLASLLSPRLGL